MMLAETPEDASPSMLAAETEEEAPFRPLQFTSLLFLVPAVATSTRPLVTTVLALNAAVSFAVHSFDRPSRTPLDTADNVLVGLWVCVNASLLRGARFWAAAVACAGIALGLGVWRLQWPKGPPRTAIHAAMHTVGAAGTLLLLL